MKSIKRGERLTILLIVLFLLGMVLWSQELYHRQLSICPILTT